MSTAFSCCICFVLSLACDDKSQVTYNISEQRNTQLSVTSGTIRVGRIFWIQMMSNKGIKRENSYIHIFKLQTELNVHPLIYFSFVRWSIYFCRVPVNHSPLHARTQQYALLRNKKNKQNTRENYHSAEIKAQSRSSSVFSSTLW